MSKRACCRGPILLCAFSSALGESLITGVPFNETNGFDQDCFNNIESVWANAHNPYPSVPTGNTIDVIDKVFTR